MRINELKKLVQETIQEEKRREQQKRKKSNFSRIVESTIQKVLLEAEDEEEVVGGDPNAEDQPEGTSGGGMANFKGAEIKDMVSRYKDAIESGSVTEMLEMLASTGNDSQFVEFLRSARETDEGGPEDDVLTWSETTISPSQLVPSQNEIDFNSSVAFALCHVAPDESVEGDKGSPGWEWGVVSACTNAKHVPGFAVITANGNTVIDGHHRWSGTYACNPDANLLCWDFTFPDGKATPKEQMLVTFHSAIAAASGKPANFEGSKANPSMNITGGKAKVKAMMDSQVGSPAVDPSLKQAIVAGQAWVDSAKANMPEGVATKMGFADAASAIEAAKQALPESEITDGAWENCPFRKVVLNKMLDNVDAIAKIVVKSDPARPNMPQSDSKSMFGADKKKGPGMVKDLVTKGMVHHNADFDPEQIQESKVDLSRWQKLAGLLKD